MLGGSGPVSETIRNQALDKKELPVQGMRPSRTYKVEGGSYSSAPQSSENMGWGCCSYTLEVIG